MLRTIRTQSEIDQEEFFGAARTFGFIWVNDVCEEEECENIWAYESNQWKISAKSLARWNVSHSECVSNKLRDTANKLRLLFLSMNSSVWPHFRKKLKFRFWKESFATHVIAMETFSTNDVSAKRFRNQACNSNMAVAIAMDTGGIVDVLGKYFGFVYENTISRA